MFENLQKTNLHQQMRNKKVGRWLANANDHENNGDQRKSHAEDAQNEAERVVVAGLVIVPHREK